jgi:hypothetical protein
MNCSCSTARGSGIIVMGYLQRSPSSSFTAQPDATLKLVKEIRPHFHTHHNS